MQSIDLNVLRHSEDKVFESLVVERIEEPIKIINEIK